MSLSYDNLDNRDSTNEGYCFIILGGWFGSIYIYTDRERLLLLLS